MIKVNEQFEGQWRVTWNNLNWIDQYMLRIQLIEIVFSCVKTEEVGFSLDDCGSKAFTIYLNKSNAKDFIVNDGYLRFSTMQGTIQCCMFSNKKDAELFADAAEKFLMWNKLKNSSGGNYWYEEDDKQNYLF